MLGSLRIINGKRMDSREHAHAHLVRRLHLPQYYGRNLDALSDCLSEIGRPTTILVRNAASLRESLGDYGSRLLAVLDDAAKKNGLLTILLRERI